MVRLDTIKLKIPDSCIESFDLRNKLVSSINHSRNGISYDIEPIPEYGIHSAKYFKENGELSIGMSSKILLDDYLELISKDNIDKVLSQYSKISPIKLNLNKAIEQATILSCDSTSNIRPSYELSLVRDATMLSSTNSRFIAKSYGGRSLGVEIVGKAKSVKTRMIGYSKYLNLQAKKGNDFLNSCNDASKLISSSKGVWRIEQNHTSFRSIRERFKINNKGSILLVDLLNSKANPNYDLFNKIVSERKELDLDILSNEKLGLVQSKLGKIKVANTFNRDIELIRIFIKSRVKGNISKYIKDYRNIIRELNLRDACKSTPELKKADAVIHEILSLLKAS